MSLHCNASCQSAGSPVCETWQLPEHMSSTFRLLDELLPTPITPPIASSYSKLELSTSVETLTYPVGLSQKGNARFVSRSDYT